MSKWHEERRKDRAAAAEQARADRKDAATLRRKERADKDARSRARRQAVAAWLNAHSAHLLFVPVIVIPAVLAWPAMAAYGWSVFGALGVLLPGFTEGTMWTFSFAIPAARRAGRPVLWLFIGLWTSAAMAGGMNYAHGAETSVAHGVVMAAVSVGGVVVHQLAGAGPTRPRPTRAERAAAAVARRAARRVVAVQRAAVDGAAAELSADGTAVLVFRPGTVRLDRRPWRAARLRPVAVPGLPVRPLEPGEEIAAEVSAYLLALPDAEEGGKRPDGSGNAVTSPVGLPEATARKVPGYVAKARAAIAEGVIPADVSQNALRRFLRIRGEVAAVVHRHLFAGPDDAPQAVAG